jgi:hypothetical protein
MFRHRCKDEDVEPLHKFIEIVRTDCSDTESTGVVTFLRMSVSVCSKLIIMTGSNYITLRISYTSPQALEMACYIAGIATMEFLFLNFKIYQ